MAPTTAKPFDVAILAGGLSRRIAGVWDGPKCLVPVAGRPVLEILLTHAQAIRGVQNVRLVLGYRSTAVLAWLRANWPTVPYVEELYPAGTAAAMRRVLPWLSSPVLVLNGDTIPEYSLAKLMDFYWAVHPRSSAVAWHGGQHAGAAVLNPATILDILTSDHESLDTYLKDAAHYRVPGFFDVGTPENFHKAKHLKGDYFDPH
jgi:NDP-sugar pyrophosphorylase family protein